jgi:regulator of ribosome biosynthesis
MLQPKEPAPKHTGRKRKFESVIGDMESERKRALEVFEKIQKKKPVLDASRAANKHLAEEQKSGKKVQKSGKKSKSQIKKMNGAKKSRKKGGRR